jgi:hypothetical protein
MDPYSRWLIARNVIDLIFLIYTVSRFFVGGFSNLRVKLVGILIMAGVVLVSNKMSA